MHLILGGTLDDRRHFEKLHESNCRSDNLHNTMAECRIVVIEFWWERFSGPEEHNQHYTCIKN